MAFSWTTAEQDAMAVCCRGLPRTETGGEHGQKLEASGKTGNQVSVRGVEQASKQARMCT